MRIPSLNFMRIGLALISLYAVVVNIAVPLWCGTFSSPIVSSTSEVLEFSDQLLVYDNERAAGGSSNSNAPTSTTMIEVNDVVGTDGGAEQQDDLNVVNASTKTKYSSDISSLRTRLRKDVDLSGCTKSYEQRSCGKKRRPSLPFVSGDTFRCLADIIFDETNQWKPSAEDFKCLHYLRTQENFGNKPFVVFLKTDQSKSNNHYMFLPSFLSCLL